MKYENKKNYLFYLDINLLYHDAVYYWSMDMNIKDDLGNNLNSSFVAGVSNKAIRPLEWKIIKLFAPLQRFSLSMWVKIVEKNFIMKIPRLNLIYDGNSTLKIYITPYKANCSYLLIYQWPHDIFLHMVVISQDTTPYLKLYKNSVKLNPYSSEKSHHCGEVQNSVEVFPGMTYDDIAIWSREIKPGDIYQRYSK